MHTVHPYLLVRLLDSCSYFVIIYADCQGWQKQLQCKVISAHHERRCMLPNGVIGKRKVIYTGDNSSKSWSTCCSYIIEVLPFTIIFGHGMINFAPGLVNRVPPSMMLSAMTMSSKYVSSLGCPTSRAPNVISLELLSSSNRERVCFFFSFLYRLYLQIKLRSMDDLLHFGLYIVKLWKLEKL